MRIASLSLLALCLAIAALPASAQTLYANGPTNGICDIQACTVDAWAAGFGFTVGNSFTLSSASTISTINMAFWLFPGDTMTSLSGEFGVDHDDATYGSFTVTPGNGLSESFISSNQFGFDIDLVTVSGLSIDVPAGTSWLTLTDGSTNTGDQFYWDENNGPSAGFENTLGSIPSESFNLQGGTGSGVGSGTGPGTVPEPSSIMLFGSGILGLAGVLRRKLF
jgi:hypothetical protein